MNKYLFMIALVVNTFGVSSNIFSDPIVIFSGGDILIKVFDVTTGDQLSNVQTIIDDSVFFYTHKTKWQGRLVKTGYHTLRFIHKDYHSEVIDNLIAIDDTVLELSVWLKPKHILVDTTRVFSSYKINKIAIKRSIITGHVLDQESKLPIQGAEIRFDLLDTILTAVSDSQGNYECQINRIMNGIGVFNCSHPDYYRLTIESKTSVYSYKTDGDVKLVKKEKSFEHLKRRNLKKILLTISSESGGGGGSVKKTSESMVGVGEEFLIKNPQDNSVESILLPSSFILLEIVSPNKIIVQYDNSALRCYPKDVEHIAPNQVIISNNVIGFGTKTTCSGTIYSISIAGHP